MRCYTTLTGTTFAPLARVLWDDTIRWAEVVVGKAEGLPKRGVVNGDALVTMGKSVLAERAGVLSAKKRAQLDAAPRFALALEALT